MPVLTRRRDPDAQQETWLIHYGDTHIGTIRLHAGVGGVDRWAWSCGFYPASHRGVRADGSARTFPTRPAPTSRRLMKFVSDRPFANPAIAARKLVEIANGIETMQDGPHLPLFARKGLLLPGEAALRGFTMVALREKRRGR
jgi:hypothetical protein